MDYGVRVTTDEIERHLQMHAFRCRELDRAIILTPWWRVFTKLALREEKRWENIKLKRLRNVYRRRTEEHKDSPPISENEQVGEGLRKRGIPDCDRWGLEWLFATWEPYSLQTYQTVFNDLKLDFASFSGTEATFVHGKGERLVLKPYGLCEWRRSRHGAGGGDVGSNCNWRDPSDRLGGIISDYGLDELGKRVRRCGGGQPPQVP